MRSRTKATAKSGKIQKPGFPWKIFIVEDHPAFREGLVQIISGEKDLCVCGQAGDVARAVRAIARLKPDLVLVDITLPGKSGLELIKALRARNTNIRILVVSMHQEALYVDRVLRAGGDGYIMKQEDPAEIIHAMRDVLAGRIYVSEEVMTGSGKTTQRPAAKTAMRPVEQLTDLELNILEMLGRGKDDPEIARRLQLNTRNVSARCLQMRKKLKLKSNNALVRYAALWLEDVAQ